MRKLILTVAILASTFQLFAQQNSKKLLLRLDDFGMNHSVNMAIEEVAKSGIPFSTSVMFACPWYQEAVAILKKYPNVSVGVHLTLNSEWMYYRWGPVLGKTAVPSLVDSVGYFYPSDVTFLKSSYKLDEVEKELSAQIERALGSGLKIDYIDHHMGMAAATPQLREVFERLAKKYNLGMSRYFQEDYKTMFETPVKEKKSVLLSHLAALKTNKVNLVVLHIAKADPEMNAIVDMNSADMQSTTEKSVVAKHRSAELNAVLSPEVSNLIKKNNIQLVTYRDLKEDGLEKMVSPVKK
ncbi:MAG: hypothetical protein JWQ25_1204 [Daejeonella sp.]|nr:hypothetical protein [Daejeonella sp.]